MIIADKIYNRPNIFNLSYLFLLILSLSFIPDVFSQDSTLIAFTFRDQFNNIYTRDDFAGHILIVVGSDREGSPFNELWSFAIYDSLKKYSLNDSVRFLPVADVRGVPFFLKGMVKSKFPREKKRWILLDWKGLFAKAYRFIAGSSNILLIRRDGRVVYHVYGREPDPEKLNNLLQKLYNLPGMNKR